MQDFPMSPNYKLLYSSEGRLCVLDYCPRNLVSVTGVEPGSMPGVLGEPGTSVWLTLLQNCEQRTQVIGQCTECHVLLSRIMMGCNVGMNGDKLSWIR